MEIKKEANDLIDTMSQLKFTVDEIQTQTRLIIRDCATSYRINKVNGLLLILDNHKADLKRILDSLSNEET